MLYTVYILRTSSNTLYTGQTNNLEKRLKEHKSKTGKASKYLRQFAAFDLVYKEEYETRTEALRREMELKSWTKTRKEVSIKNNHI